MGKPFLVYGQKTKAVADGRPLHAGTGYLRVPGPGCLELVLAHPNGITEIDVGSYSVTGDLIEIELATTSIGLTPTAKEVTALGRTLRIDGDELSYSMRMAAVGQPCKITSTRCCTESLDFKFSCLTPSLTTRPAT